METWSVYIGRCADGILYTGIATYVARRVEEHNANNLLAPRYTRARRPVVLVYEEAAGTRSAANRCIHRDRHSLQQLARSWVSRFSRQCRQPGFDLTSYLKELAKPQTEMEP